MTCRKINCSITVNNIILTLMLILATLTISELNAEDLILAENSKPKSAIIIKPDAGEKVNKAANELVQSIKLMSGAELPIIKGDIPNGMLPIRLGAAADPALANMISAKGENPSAFSLVADKNGISIRGLSDEGTLFGVYELLEQLGMRWYMPGRIGMVAPSLNAVSVKYQQTVQVPSMDFRALQSVKSTDWLSRMRMGGSPRSTGGHGIPPFTNEKEKKELFVSHPEYFALINGKRCMKQICISNPDVLKLVCKTLQETLKKEGANPKEKQYIGMGPDDGMGFCECDKCKALDGGVHDPLSNTLSMTDRYIWFMNHVLETLEGEYPNLHIAWYVYSCHLFPPKDIKPNKRIVNVLAPIALDRIRGMDNPMSPDRHILRYLIDTWSQFGCDEMYYRGYYNNLACPQFPISQVDRLKNELPVFRKKGINVMRVEVIKQSWASSPLTLYVAAKMMWNVDTDVDALLEEFYEKFYGPAKGPMKAYHEAVEAAFRDTPYFAGSSYPYFIIYDQKRRDTVRGFLEAAAKAAGDNQIYAERVHINQLAFERLELFLDIITARNNFDFAKANEKMKAYNKLTDSMVDYVIDADHKEKTKSKSTLVNEGERSTAKGNYFNRFFERSISSGYQRTVTDGELVKGLPDVWDFLIDPTGIGEAAGWQRAGVLGANWQPLKTLSAVWSDQGLHYYKGIAWYRTRLVIPEKFNGRDIYLWFGGVDGLAKVWVNEQLLGTSREPAEGLPGVPGSFRPFDMNATSAIKFGEENTVTVQITINALSETGTGGLIAPVMFWSPKEPGKFPGKK